MAVFRTSTAFPAWRRPVAMSALIRPLAITLLLGLAAALPARAEEHRAEPPRVEALTERSAVIADEQGVPSGFFVELMGEMLRRADVEGEIRVLPWKRAYRTALERPDVLLFPVSLLPEREASFHWLPAVFRVRWVLFRKAGSAVAPASLEEARRVGSIAVYRGDARQQLLERLGFTNLVVVNDPCLARKMLASGRVDLLAGSDMPSSETGFAELGDLDAQMEPALTLREFDLHPVFSLGTDPSVVEACRRALDGLLRDGTYAAIYRRWYDSPRFSALGDQP